MCFRGGLLQIHFISLLNSPNMYLLLHLLQSNISQQRIWCMITIPLYSCKFSHHILCIHSCCFQYNLCYICNLNHRESFVVHLNQWGMKYRFLHRTADLWNLRCICSFRPRYSLRLHWDWVRVNWAYATQWISSFGGGTRPTCTVSVIVQLLHTHSAKHGPPVHTQTHTHITRSILACIKWGTVDLGVRSYQPSVLSMHVKPYSTITCSIVAPPSPLWNMVEIAEGASTFQLCLRLIPGISCCCQYLVSVYSDPKWPNDMLAKCSLSMLATRSWARGSVLQKSTTLAVSFARTALDSAAGKVLTSISISAGLRCRMISVANWRRLTPVNRAYLCTTTMQAARTCAAMFKFEPGIFFFWPLSGLTLAAAPTLALLMRAVCVLLSTRSSPKPESSLWEPGMLMCFGRVVCLSLGSLSRACVDFNTSAWTKLFRHTEDILISWTMNTNYMGPCADNTWSIALEKCALKCVVSNLTT